MSKSIISMIPDAKSVLELEPEELAGVLIEFLNSLPPFEGQQLDRHNLLVGEAIQYPSEAHDPIKKAFSEAWAWLERECLVAAMPGAEGEWVFITRRGQKLVDRSAYEAYRRATVLPRSILHPRIDARVYPAFLRGAYETAVFEAFEEVEVAIREASGFGPEKYGTGLMRDALGPNGPLVDKTAPVAEQEALAHLFAGSMGLYKDLTRHRSEIVTSPAEAARVIMLASHLLRLVDTRTATPL